MTFYLTLKQSGGMRVGLHMFIHRELERVGLFETNPQFLILFFFILLLQQSNLLSITSEVLLTALIYILQLIFDCAKTSLSGCSYQKCTQATTAAGSMAVSSAQS